MAWCHKFLRVGEHEAGSKANLRGFLRQLATLLPFPFELPAMVRGSWPLGQHLKDSGCLKAARAAVGLQARQSDFVVVDPINRKL